MPADPAKLGICKTGECVARGNGPVERYEGPGMYCPDCGELLEAYVPEKPESSLPKASARAAPVGEPSAAAPPKTAAGRLAAYFFASRRRTLNAVLIVAGGVIAVFAVLWTMGGHSRAPGTVGVCGSSMTARVASDVLHGYGKRNPAQADHFELRTTDCSVRFSADLNEPRGRTIIGLDGVVAIVNPQNPVGKLSAEQLRKIVAGNLTNWSSVGGRSQPIVGYLPADSTDEAHVVAAALMKGTAVGTSVVRVSSSADAVRAVVAANGSNAIGLVAFSGAVPSKVLTVQDFPTPSVLTIGDRRYPLSVAVTVASDDAARDATVGALLTYAGSDEAKAIAARDGIVVNGAAR